MIFQHFTFFLRTATCFYRAMHYRMRYCDCMSSVCLSVRPPVCDVGGSHRLEILKTNCTDNQLNTFTLHSRNVIHLIIYIFINNREHGEIWGRVEAWWGKVACWSTKAAISLKRVKTEEKLPWRAYRNSSTLFRMVPSPTPYGLLFPTIGVRNPYEKL